MVQTSLLYWIPRFVLVGSSIALAQPTQPSGVVKSFGEVVSHAEETSCLHSKHTPPYHLKANILETTNPQSEYRAQIEEFFRSEKNWRRVVTAPGLSWTQEMIDGKLQDEDSGDYAPLWLRGLLQGITDPLPQHKQFENMEQPFRMPQGPHSTSCLRGLTGNLQVCIEGEHDTFGFLTSDPGGLEFHDYEPFHNQWIARKLISNPESGTTLQLTIVELSDLKDPDTAPQMAAGSAPLLVLQVAQAVEQSFLKTNATMTWPLVRGGNLNGNVRLFIGIGPNGKVREVWPDASDNGEIEDFARQQLGTGNSPLIC
jgi:hypothetical protein